MGHNQPSYAVLQQVCGSLVSRKIILILIHCVDTSSMLQRMISWVGIKWIHKVFSFKLILPIQLETNISTAILWSSSNCIYHNILEYHVRVVLEQETSSVPAWTNPFGCAIPNVVNRFGEDSRRAATIDQTHVLIDFHNIRDKTLQTGSTRLFRSPDIPEEISCIIAA